MGDLAPLRVDYCPPNLRIAASCVVSRGEKPVVLKLVSKYLKGWSEQSAVERRYFVWKPVLRQF